jgi:hypothetical protein
MPVVPFSAWRPDLGIYAGTSEARNCIRMTEGYKPLGSLADFGAGAIVGLPTLLATAKGSDAVMHVFSGDETQLYKLDAATMAWNPVGGPYLGGTNRWRGVQWGDELVYARAGDDMQVINLVTGLPFEILQDDPAEFAPQARYAAACGPYLVVGNTVDSVDGAKPNRIRWCGIEQIRAWKPSAETTADWQDQPDLGELRGLTGGRQLSCLFEDGIAVGSLIGAPKAFRFDPVVGAQGCLEPNSVVQFRGSTYYLSRDGFQRFDGRQAVPIGWRKINRWFFGDALFDKLPLMSCMVDMQQKIIVWLYCGRGSDGITPNHMMIYEYDNDDFTWSDIEGSTLQLLGGFTTPGYNIDNIDGLAPGGSVDLLPAPLDDPFYSGGVPLSGAFQNKRLVTLTGNPMTGVLDIPYTRFNPMGRSMVTEVRDVIEGHGTVQCQMFSRDEVAQRPEREGPLTVENRFGFFPVRSEGAWHKGRLFIGGPWKGAYGLDVTARPTGGR